MWDYVTAYRLTEKIVKDYLKELWPEHKDFEVVVGSSGLNIVAN
jgi:hypothetical protein